MSNAHAKKWLLKDFEPNTRDKANGRTRLLIFDGHGSHTTSDIIRHCILNRIQLALLPPHSSHLTQPLDVGVFSSMKVQMTREMDRIVRTGVPRIHKVEWLDAFIAGRQQAFTTSNIISGWSGTGLYPFNPQKVLGRIPLPPIDIPHRELTPFILNPLDNPELNSSPIETPAMNAANDELKHRARTRSSEFNTPARKHVVRLTTALNRSLAKNRIQATQLSDLQRIISTRKQRQSGKHKILRGETILATPSMLQRVEASEAVTRSRRVKKSVSRVVRAQSVTPPPNIDPTLSLQSPGSSSEDEPLDCIVVAFP